MSQVRETPRKPRVLIVESDPVQAVNLEYIVSTAGCDVVGPAGRSEVALDLLRNTLVDAAILEVGQDRSVFPVATALRKRKIPFIVTTAVNRDLAREAGFKEIILLKPVERVVLEKMITYLTEAPR
jgi:DNA-binding response OmpR family regulator